MKKLLGIVVLGLLLGCATDNFKSFNSLSKEEKNKIRQTRDARINLFPGDKNLVYIGSFGKRWDKGYGVRNTDGKNCDIFLNCTPSAHEIAIKKCKEEFNLTDTKEIDYRVVPKEISKKHLLFSQVYWVYECFGEKSSYQVAEEESSASNNTLNKSFTCSYKYDSSEKSKIKIRGGSATETTAIGIAINYSIVNLSDKGAFTLKGSSKQGRAWFIGAQSYLLLGTEMHPYTCN